jgi:AcrR family transcriptional regulator
MEASTARRLDSEKARRIVAAMRASVGERGAAGATFDHVAQKAGVSRGLLHYYFGSKERLLVEVVRHDIDLRLRSLEEGLAGADSVDAIIEVLVSHLQDFIDRDPASSALVYELFTASRRNEELRTALAELFRSCRTHVATVLEEKEQAGIVHLRGDAESVAAVLFALADGLTLQSLADPDWDRSPVFAAGIRTAKFLLGD